MENKNLEALQEIAVKILKANENTSLEELLKMTQALQEGLIIQSYLQNNPVENTKVTQVKPVQKTEEPTPVEQPENRENLAEPLIEKIKDIVAQMPGETHHVDEMLKEILPEKKSHFSELEEFAATYQETPVFEKKAPKTEDEPIKEATDKEVPTKEEAKQQEEKPKTPEKENETVKKKSLNDKLTKNIQIGLNDRLSLTKHLFADNASDYNRVVSQVTTLGSFDEAHQFIMEQVKADYNWEGKEVYLERFLLLIEKRFD